MRCSRESLSHFPNSKENDYATQVLLQWFISEQVERKKNASNIVEQLKMIGESGSAMLILDRELGARRIEPSAETNSAAT